MITHVAIQYDGQTYSLPKPNRHYHVIRLIGGIKGPHKEGFLDATGRFLSRIAAMQMAKDTKQFKREPDPKLYQGPELFSEDLW
jgi:hypothetical protein